jgi:hypothetical protein
MTPRDTLNPFLRRALEGIDAAVTGSNCPRFALLYAVRERTKCEVERDAVIWLERALDANRSHSVDPFWMREATDNLENAAKVLAELLRDGADYAEAGHRRAAE